MKVCDFVFSHLLITGAAALAASSSQTLPLPLSPALPLD